MLEVLMSSFFSTFVTIYIAVAKMLRITGRGSDRNVEWHFGGK